MYRYEFRGDDPTIRHRADQTLQPFSWYSKTWIFEEAVKAIVLLRFRVPRAVEDKPKHEAMRNIRSSALPTTTKCTHSSRKPPQEPRTAPADTVDQPHRYGQARYREWRHDLSPQRSRNRANERVTPRIVPSAVSLPQGAWLTERRRRRRWRKHQHTHEVPSTPLAKGNRGSTALMDVGS